MKRNILGIIFTLFSCFFIFNADKNVHAAESGFEIHYYEDYYMYDGEAVEPPISKVTYRESSEANAITLTEDVDYVLRYSDNVNAGTGKITVYGRGMYTGSYSTDFTIYPKPINLDSDYTVHRNDDLDNSPTIELSNENKILKQNIDYELSYQNNTNAGDDAVIVATGIGNYCSTITIPFTIYRKNLSTYGKITCDDSSLTYTGKSINPDITVSFLYKNNQTTLSENIDYNVSYINNVDVGKASIVITGVGNYTGSCSFEFVIEPLPISECEINEIKEYTYSGNEIKPEIDINFNSKKLLHNMDYMVSYDNNINAGNAYLTITGINNYIGSYSVIFTINPIVLTNMEYSFLGVKNQKYTGYEITLPDVGISGLQNGRDYELSYDNNIEPGIALVTATGIGNYEGSIFANFWINGKLDSGTDDSSNMSMIGVLGSGTTNTKKIGTVTLLSKKILKKGKKYTLSIRWKRLTNAKKYQIFSYTKGKWKKIKNISKCQYKLTKRKKGKYKFKIRGYNLKLYGKFKYFTANMR